MIGPVGFSFVAMPLRRDYFRRWFTVVGTFEDPMRPGSNATLTFSSVAALTTWAQKPERQWLVILRSDAPGVAIRQVRPDLGKQLKASGL